MLLARKPWLLPAVITMVKHPFAMTTSEIAERLGVKSALIKRALWWLSKIDAVACSESIPRRCRLREQARREAMGILQSSFQREGRLVLRQGREYLLIAVKPTRISVWTVPVEVVERVYEALRAGGGCFKPGDVANALGIPPRLASLSLTVLYVVGRASRRDGCYQV